MTDVRQWVWKLNMADMTCLNEEHNVIVKIDNAGKEVKGRMTDMSMELFNKISGLMNGPAIIRQITLEAENEFQRQLN